MDLLFLSPYWLLLLPLAALAFVWPKRVSTPREKTQAWLRVAAWSAVVLACAEPVSRSESADVHRVFVLATQDATEAGRTAALDAVVARRATLDSDVRVHWVLDQDLADSLSGRDELQDDEIVVVPAGATVVDQLLRGRSTVPSGSDASLTLVSTSVLHERVGDLAKSRLSAFDLPIHTVVVESEVGEFRITDVQVPLMRVGQSSTLRVELVGGRDGADAEIELQTQAGELLGRADGFTVDGRGSMASMSVEPDRSGFVPARLIARNGGDEASFDLTLAIQDPLRVLHLGGVVDGAGARLQELLGPGFEVVQAPDMSDVLTLDPARLDGVDVVFVDDRPASEFPDSAQQSLIEAARERGVGLVVAGGSASFGPGGYQDSPLADVMPVEFVQREEKRDPSTTLVIIIDTSGSMGGMRVTLAKEVSRLAMRRLLPHDKVGIVEFYGAKRWAAPIQSAANRIELQRAINRMDAGGGTVIMPAIEEAFYGLQNVQTRYKHVLVLTDGGVESGAFEPLVRSMADEGINVSTVLVGPEAHSEFLVQIANWGKGRFYSVPNRFNLPELLLKQPATAKLPAYRPGEHAVTAAGSRGFWGDVDTSTVPNLLGYVETQARPGAETVLATAAEGHPVLASWRVGLGRVTCMMTEPFGAGTENWAGWDQYGAFLGRVLTRTASDLREPFRVTLRHDTDGSVVVAERRGDHQLRPVGRIEGGDELSFVQRSPDRFDAVVARWWDSAADLRLGVSSGGMGQPFRAAVSRAQVGSSIAHRSPRNQLAMTRLAASTGGSNVSVDALVSADLPTRVSGVPTRLSPFWPWLCALGLIAYLGGVYHRRRSPRSSNAG